MPIDNKKLKNLYDAMRQEGYDQSYDEFRGAFLGNNNYANRKDIYDTMSSGGYNLGKTYAEFMTSMKVAPKQANNRAAAQAAAAKSAPTQPEKGGWRPNAEQRAGYQRFTDGVIRTVKNGDDVMNRVNTRVARAKRPNQQKVNLGFNNKHSLLGGGSQVQHEGKKFDAAKGDFVDQYSTEAGNVYDNAYEADAEQYNINRNKRDAETLDMVADIERQIREQEELLEKTRKASRDVKAPDNLWDALRYTMSHADGPRLDQEDIDEEAIKANITNLQNKRSLLLHGTSIGQKVGKSIGDQLAEVNKMIGDDIDNYYKRHPNGGPTLVSHDYHATGQYQINPYLDVAARSLEDAQEMFNEAGKSVGESGLSGFGAGVLRGFGSKLFDARTWDMGFTDIKGGLSLAEVLRKADEGKPLTAEQQKMLDAKATELACAAYFSGALGRGYKAGQVTAESIPFMLEFMLNPLSGTGRSAQAMLTRYALKRFGRKATMELGEDAAKKILYGDIRQLTKSVFDKGLSKGARGLAAKTLASKAGARIAGDITGAAGMTATTGQGRVVADMLNRATGQVKFGVDTDGRVKYTGHDAPEESSLLTAYGKAFGSQFSENYSEFMGPYISYVGGMFANGLKKIGGKYLFDGLSSLRNRSAAAVMKLPFAPMVSDFIREATKSDWAKVIKGMQKRAHWDGTAEEYLEEVAGNMLNAILVGDNDFSTEEGRGVFNLSDNIDTFLGVGLMSGAMSVSSAAGYRTPAYRARKMVENADARGEKLLGSSLWGKFKSSFDAAQSEQDKQVILTALLQNSSLTNEGRRAALQYASGRQFQQAVADGTFREMEEDAENGNEVERACRAEYTEGQNIDSVEEMRDAKTRYNVLLREALAVEPNAEMYSDPQFYEQSNPNATPEQKAAMRAYAEAKAQYEGVADRMKTDMADQQQKANEQVDRFKNQTDGLITRVRLRGSDAEFYVTSGHISLNNDGTINDAATSSNLTIVDGEGNQRFISRGDVVDVLAQNTPEETLEQLNDIIMNEAKAKADLIDGKLSFHAGDTFTILNNEGQEQKVTIAQDPSTMAMSAVIEGEQAAVPLTEDSMAKLQQMSDAYQESRFGKYRQEQQDAVANAENEATQEEATPTSPTASQEETSSPTEGRSYGYGESVSYVDGEGHTQDGVVHGKTPDGTYEVEFDNPPSGKNVVDAYTQEELDALVQPSSAEQTEEVAPSTEAPTEATAEEEPAEPQDNEVADSVPPTTEELVEMARGGNELAQYQLEQQGIQWKEPAEQTKDNAVAQSPKKDVPRDKDGNIIYDQVPVATTIEDLYDGALDDEEIGNFVQSQIDAANKAVDKITKKKPQISTNKSAYLEAKKKWEGELREAERKAQYWNDVKAEVEKITTPADARGWKDELSGEAARRQYRENSGNDHEAKSASEVAAEFFSQSHVKVTPESYRKETGFGLDEQRKMVGKISKEGKTIDRLSEELALFDEEYYNGRFFGGDSMVAKDALIAHLSSADARKGVSKVQSEAEAQFVEDYEEQRERYYQERYHMSYEEYIEYSAQEMPELMRKYSNFDEQQFYNRYADEIEADLTRREQQSNNNNGPEENDSTREEQRHDRGNQVQSGQRTDDNSGSEGGEDSEGAVRTRDEGSDEQKSSSEEIDESEEARQARIKSAEYKYDKEMRVYGHTGHLYDYRDGTAIYLDEDGNPLIYLAAKNDNTYVGLFRDDTGMWSAKMENALNDKAAFRELISSVMNMLPNGARFYEHTNVSADGLRVFAQQLNHGFIVSDETYECGLNGEDRANILGEKFKGNGEFDSVSNVSETDLEYIKSALKPYMEALGRTTDDIRLDKNGKVLLTLPVLVKEEARNRADRGVIKKERQNDLQKIIEIDGAERTEMEARIVDWLSEENLSRAAGKTRAEIFEEFGNKLEPIAYIPTRFISLVSPTLKDQRIYCGKGYFIDHALRNHGGVGTQISPEDVDVSKYLNIQSVLDNPDAIKETMSDGKRTVVFIKKIGRFFAELTQVEEDGKIVLHKSLFNQKKEPYAKLNDIRQEDTSSEGGTSSISHAENSAPAISLQSRGDAVSSEKNEHTEKPSISGDKGKEKVSSKQGSVGRKNVYGKNKVADWRTSVSSAMRQYETSPHDAHVAMCDIIDGMDSNALYGLMRMVLRTITSLDNENIRDGWKVDATHDLFDILKDRGFVVTKGSKGVAIGDVVIDKHGIIYVVEGVGKSRLDCGLYDVNDKTIIDHMTISRASVKYYYRDVNGKKDSVRLQKADVVDAELMAEEKPFNAVIEMLRKKFPDASMEALTAADRLLREQALPGERQKAIEAVAKALGLKVEWRDTMEKENGTFNPKTRTITIARDSEHALANTFGHEVTHAVRNLSEADYKNLKDAVRRLYSSEKEYNEAVQAYGDMYTGLDFDALEEELIADNIGFMIGGKNDMTQELASRMNHRVLWAIHDAMNKVRNALAKVLHIDSKKNGLLEAIDSARATIRETMANAQRIAKEKGQGLSNESGSARQSLRTQDSVSEIAEKHGVAADDVRLYAEGMKSGNLQKADWALSEIRRTMRVANRGMKLSEFGKLFRPIQKELAERYGDIERLRQEHIDAEMRERNLMEAARKKAEEEERNRQARLEELSLLGDAEVDKRYMDALKRGDEATAREMLDEAARRKGYGDAESDYQGEGAWAAPSNPGYKSADERRADLENNTIFNVEDMALGYSAQPEDYFKYPKRYAQDTPHGRESTQSIQKAIEAVKRGEKDVKVKVYRAVPTSVKEGKLRNGDWVTPSRIYAEMHGNNRLEGKYRIIEDEVPVDELWWDGNDANEWGYDNGKGYKYKNVKNNRKSDDLVTRDDKGNVIPPSKRFNQRKADERYQKRTDGVKPSKAEVALRDALVEHMRLSFKDMIADEEGQRVLDMANGQGIKMSFGEPYDYDNYPRGRVEPNLNKISVKIVDTAGNDKGFLNYVEAEKWAKEHLCKVYTDEETGGKGEFSIVPKVINKYVSKAARDKSDNEYLHYVVLQNLPSIIHDSIDTETHPNFTSHGAKKEAGVFTYDKNTLVHVLYGAVKIGDKLCRVKLTAKEYPNNERTKPYSFMVTSIDTEIESLEPIGVQARSEDGYSNNSISAAKLLNGVEMSYDKGKNLLEESEKHSNNLREQRVYHGSGADFEAFDHIRFFRTANGEAYGFTVGGKIYIDPRIATSETPVHEYAHLWATALKSANAKEWQNVVGLMKGTKVWDEVKALYPELKSDDEIADEVLATYSGRRGAERLREEQRRIAKGNGSVFEKAEAISALESVKQALKRFWKGVADFLHIHYTSAEEVSDRVMKDLLDGVDPRKFGDGGKSLDAYNKIRKHFIGEQGAERADHAEEVTTRIDNLNVAREMEDAKKDAKAIKMATGWERGADGKWRYEIPDLKYFSNGYAGWKKARARQPWIQELDALSDKLFEGEDLSDSEMARFDELAAKESAFKAEFLNREKPHLADWVENDELFKAYPDLKRVNVVFTDQLPTNVGGSYNEREHTIVVNTNYVGDIDSVLAHEVQHAIQKIEGFARGGNPESIQERFKAAKKEWRARAWADELRYKADEMGEHYNQAAVEKALIDEYKEMGMDNEEWMPDKETRMKGFNYFARGYADRSMDADIKNFRLAESTRADFSPYMEYTKLGGEVESRNVEKRMKMSPEERRASLAAETEDVSREDQIFLFGEGGTSMKTSSDLNEMFGSRWLDEQTNDDGRHTTQVKSTINSYKKFVDWVKRDSNGRDVDVLDASSGLGLGTAWMRDNGFKVDDVEPFPSDSREAPTFSSYDEIDKKYDYIISNAVLNVIPDDWRANVLHQMADKLKDGGKLVINVRGAEGIRKQGIEGKTRTTLDDASEILVHRPDGSIKSYQKGFTKSELKDWCEKELGEGYSVEIANNKNAGGSYDTAVVVAKNNESDIETINTKFNEELQQQIDGTLPEGHIYKMGKPGRILLSTGVPNLPIQMNAKRLQVKATLFDHDFDLSEVKDLVRVLQHPLAVFAYGDKSKAQNIIVPLQKDGKNFIVGLSLNPTVGGRKLEINSIRNVFPKDNSEWLNWINQDKALYIDKEKIQTLIDQQRTNLADVAYLDLDSVANVMENFENPKVSDENVADGGIMFRNGGAADAEKQSRRGTPNLYPDHIAQAIYEQSVNGFKFDLDEAWHDSLLSVKRLQEAISETRGVPIRDFENVYWHAVTLSSVNAAEMEQLMNLRIQPFIEAVQDICKKHDLTQEDIEVYLNCKHGLERNEAMARRAAEKQVNEEFKDELRKAERAAAKDPLDQDAADALDDVKQRMNDREEELYFENRERDYSGLTDIFDPKDKVTGDRLDLTVSELEDKAKKCVDDFENKVGVVDVTKLWDNIHELNNYSLRKSYLSGLISKSQYDSVKQMYQWYVPLRGFNEEVAGDVYTYVTRGETRTQQLLKEAKGRTSRAGDILATMMNMANSAVNQGNRNLMKQKILNLALNAKSPLLSVSSTWYQTDANGFDVPIEPPINDQMTPSEQKDAIEQWEDTMEMLAKQGKVHRMSDNLRLNLRTQKWQADEHCIRVQRGGKEYCVWVNGNPRAAQALNDRLGNQVTKPYKATETILDKAEDLFTDGFIKIFRYMAQSVTSLNPEFVISNFQRDLASASLVSTGKYGVGYTKDFLVNVKRLGVLTGTMSHKKEYRNVAGIYTLYNKYKSRTLDNNNEMERYFAEFMANGGETGYTQSLSIKDYQSRIQSALGDKGFVKWSKNAGHAVADFVEMANRGVENTCRFAAYMTSRQHGKSVLQAIVDAKEASTNFNLHGAGGFGNAWLRKSIIFINPAVQSIVQYCQLTAKHPKAMLSMLGGTIGLGAAMAFACASMVAPGGGDPDSNYWDLSDYVRHNYIVIPSGNGNWTRIALPPEIRAVYGLGVIAMEAALGRMNHSSIPAAIGDQLMQFSPVAFLDPRNFFNRSDSDHSVGKTLIKAFTPTLASPIADAYIWDEDFMGRQITGKNDFNDDKPEFQRVSYDTLPQLVSFSRWLNNISGGNDYKKGWVNINPSAAGYVASQYIGGPLQFVTKIGKTVAMITYEDLRDMRNVPFLSRFMTSTDNDYGRNQVSNAEFKYWSAIADDVRTQIRGFEKEIESGDTKNLDDYKRLVSSKEYEMYQMIDYMDWLKDIRELNQKRKEETTQDAQKQVTLEIYEVRRKMAECLNKAEEMGVYLDMSQLNLELANAKTTEEKAAIQAKINEKRKENLRKIGAIE